MRAADDGLTSTRVRKDDSRIRQDASRRRRNAIYRRKYVIRRRRNTIRNRKYVIRSPELGLAFRNWDSPAGNPNRTIERPGLTGRGERIATRETRLRSRRERFTASKRRSEIESARLVNQKTEF